MTHSLREAGRNMTEKGRRATTRHERSGAHSAVREQIYAAVRRIPPGRVATYGGIAALAGVPGRARLVGTCLREAPRGIRLPWHRVVNASGRVSLPVGGAAHARQRRLLAAEGVALIPGRIPLDRWGWPAQDLDVLLWGPSDR
jgi:methylated-DNA-protein-cysteine methyltransferase-like protein